MSFQESVLLGSIAVVMFSAHHHHMDAAKVKSIPTKKNMNFDLPQEMVHHEI